MSKFLQRVSVCGAILLFPLAIYAQQVPNAGFEDWSGEKFDGEIQPASWHASNVEQIGFKFNFAHREAGHTGNYSMRVQDQDVGAAGITETSPGYFSLGKPWVYIESITKISEATAGTAGGISWKYRPDSMSVWIKRTGDNIDKEDFYLLYYAWSGTAIGNKFKGKNGKCTSVTKEDEESDVRYELNGNECGTAQKANQIAEGMWREKKQYSNWTRVVVPIYYFNNDAPTKMNIIFSASNYPNYRANSGLYAGNSLYVDDVELIYSSKIQKLYIGGKEWKGFDPNSTEVQTYSLGETATAIPAITARRGVGSITNAHGKTVSFVGRDLAGSEITITKGDLENTPTTITVKAEDGKSTTTYKIQFQRAPSTNATLADIQVNGESLSDFRPGQMNYNVELPYGTKEAPVVSYTAAEDGQVVALTQATSPTGKATLVVTAPDGTTKMTYTLQFSIGKLKDVTLQDIKVNGKSILGFTPSQAVYKVSLPVGTQTLTVEPVSAYPKGEQTITVTPNPLPKGDAINGTTVQITVSASGATSSKTYKLNIKIEESSYAYLADLQVVGDQVADVNPAKLDDPTALAFAPDVMTYYVNLKMGTTSLPQILYTPGDEFQTITKDEGGIDGTTRITVLAGNKSDQAVYKLVFSTAKSEISTLAGIEVGGEPLPGFAPDITNYTYELPIGTTTLPEIKPIAHDEFQQISITTGGVNGKTRISVTAGNGNTTNYYITFSVKKFDDNTLKSLSVGPYYSLQDESYNPIAFDPQRNDYWVKLESDSLPTVTYALQSPEYQDTVVIYPSSSNGKYKITVRPRNGLSRTYTIQFVYRKSDNVALKMIYVADTIKHDTVAIPDFAPDKTDYTFTLDTGTTVMPEVLCEASEASQKITQAWDATNKRVIRITVLAESGAKRTYKIKFLIPSAASTQLEQIRLVEDNDTIGLPGFKSDVYEYSYPLKTGALCPTILVKKAAEEQQVTITAPYAAGLATILVKMEESSSQYTIDFVQAPAKTVQLSKILIDGVALEGFDPNQLTYTGLSYTASLPDVQGVAEGATVEVLWKANTAYLNVQDEDGNKAMYTVTFTRTLSNDNTLEGIYADGVLISGFAKTTLTYAYPLAAGSTYPEITYTTSSTSQVVFFGQVAEGKWAITVVAENEEKQTYTVQYTIAKYDDATLVDLSVKGHDLTPAFDPTVLEYAVTIDEGETLPVLTIQTREGQTILQNNASDSEQQVIVYAESGANKTYTVHYTRKPSNNPLLADILVDGVSLAGFDPNVTNYKIKLPRNTAAVPNIFPVGALSNQTITTCFSRPNGVTKILVEAQNGATKEYKISFPMAKSDNTELGDLYLDSEDAEINFKPSQTEYEVILPYEAQACPKMVYEKAEGEPEQRIDVVSRPIGQTSQIIVTAEDGSMRTYNILFKREVLKTRNLLSMIRIVELDQELSLKDKDKRDFDVEMPFESRSFSIEYEKSYPEQTVFIEPGGVNHPTIITVKANNDTVADEIYTLTPIVPTEDPATLTDIQVNGATIPGFTPEQFSYIVKVTDKPKLRYAIHKGAEIEILEQTSKHWKAEVTYGKRTNTYEVWYYYTNDVVPNMDFAEWGPAKVTTSAQKPKGWNVLADFAEPYEYKPVLVTYTYTPGEEVQQDGENSIAYLHTQYNEAPLAGYVPGYMTLGSIEYHYQRWGSSAFSVYGGIKFRNTPDVMTYRVKVDQVNNNARVLYSLNGSGGDTTLLDEIGKTNGYVERTMKLAPANAVAEDPTQLNITFNSFDSESGKNGTVGGEAKMYVDWLKFSYNHTLTGVKVDEFTASLSGTTYTAELTDPERIEKPVLLFTGEVADQAQTVTWDKPFISGNYSVRKATIRNYAENGVDYTDYKLQVKRPLDTKNVLKTLLIGGDTLKAFQESKTSYTITLPSSQHHLPDLVPVPGSSLQTVKTAYDEADSTFTITVTPEKGSVKTYTVKFTTTLSNDVTLKELTAEGVFYDPEQTTYEVTAAHMPLIAFEKQSDRQTVVLTNGVLTVTAEDGSVGTYTITRKDPTITPNGTIAEFEQNGNVLSDLGGTTYDKEAVRPTEFISFTRAQATDSVVFVQSPEHMTWTVPGTGKTYAWTYPTDLSSNADLKMITIDGENYEDFLPGELSYEILSDSTMVIAAVEGEEGQTIVSSFETVEGGVLYSMTVQAPSGASKTYRMKVTRPLSEEASLDGILLDNTLLDGFRPDSFSYVYTIPAPQGPKQMQPQMPNIAYLAGQQGQQITVVPGELNGEATTITVKSEDGNNLQEYAVAIKAEKSHCSDLTGILINGEALDYFEAGRHFYSVSLRSSEVELDYTSDDRFQTVTTTATTVKAGHEYHHTLNVTAEDGSSSEYLVVIYVENQSSDAQLANILLNGRPMERFEPLYNSDVVFDGGNNNYELKLPATTLLPEVSAQLKMDGQMVEIEYRRDEALNIDSILLNVMASDSLTHNIYVLRFVRPLSTNSLLSMIEINNEPIADFDPNTYFYTYDKQSDEQTPRITVETADEAATYDEPVFSADGSRVTITVYAQDYATDKDHKSVYTIAIHEKKSDIATLDMIYQGRDSLPGFQPNLFYYAYELNSDETFPDLSWQDPDTYPTVSPIDTVEYDPIAQKLVRQIKVTAEDTTISNTYTIAYTIRKSDIDTLQMIFVGSKPLPGFRADSLEYEYKLTAAEVIALNGELPEIDPIPGEEGKQKIDTLQVRDNYGMKTIGYKHVITVTAAAGNSRTYTVHYPRELSDDATLNMIFIDESPLPNFDAERNSYKIELDYGVPVPNVTEAAKEFQTVKHNQKGDTVEITVTAELDSVQNTYTLVFERRKSNITTLRNIVLLDKDEKQLPYDRFAFQSTLFDYTVVMPYVPGETGLNLPTISVEKEDTLQTVQITQNEVSKTEIAVNIRVLAANEEDEAMYNLLFQFMRNDDALLTMIHIALNDSTVIPLKDFKSEVYNYPYVHPYGTDSADFINASNVSQVISFVKSDSLATDTLFVEEDGTIRIIVTAQDEKTQNTYSIQQTIGKDTVNLLKMIYLDDEEYADFDPEQTFYVYKLRNGAGSCPMVTAEALSENAEISITPMPVNDTTVIYCTAQDGTDRIYRILFEESTINDGISAKENDVFIRRVAGAYQLFVATIRKDVTFIMYDQNGHMIYYHMIPDADPNAISVGKDSEDKEVLLNVDVDPNSGLLVDIVPGQVYFYSFVKGRGKIIKSGKTMAL